MKKWKRLEKFVLIYKYTTMKTHKVLDLAYSIEEGQDCFDGTRQECDDFVITQPNNFMYKVVPMTNEEIEQHPDNKQIKVVGSIDLSKFEKPKKMVRAVDIDIKKVGDIRDDFKHHKSSKPKFELKKKNQVSTKLLSIYDKPKSEFGDPDPEEVNRAFNLIKEIEKTEKGLNFLNHIARTFNPFNLNFTNKILEDGSVCCVTNKKIAGILPLSKKLVQVTPVVFTAKSMLGVVTQEDVDERNKNFSEMPEEYRVQRIGCFSQKSDKKISVAGFFALSYYLLNDTTRLLKFEVKKPSVEEILGLNKETPREYAERQRKSKLTTPDSCTFGLDEGNLSKLQALKDRM